MSNPIPYLRHLAHGEMGDMGWRMPTFSASGKRALNALFISATRNLKKTHTNNARRSVEQNFMENYKALKNAENAKYQRELANLETAIAEMRQASALTRFNKEMKALVNATKRSIRAVPKKGTTKPPRSRPSPASVARRNSLMANIKRAEKVRQTAKSIEKALSVRRQE